MSRGKPLNKPTKNNLTALLPLRLAQRDYDRCEAYAKSAGYRYVTEFAREILLNFLQTREKKK